MKKLTQTNIPLIKSIFLMLLVSFAIPVKTMAEEPVNILELFTYGHIVKAESTYVVGEDSAVFLKVIAESKERCLVLDQPGRFSIGFIESEFKKPDKLEDFFQCHLKALVLRILSPDLLLVSPLPRGNQEIKTNHYQLYEEIWIQVAQNQYQHIPWQNILAASLWFEKENNQHRTAHLLKIAHDLSKKDWLHGFYANAMEFTSQGRIKQEISETINELKNLYLPEDNYALLVGIQNYNEDKGWKDLRTPLNDVAKLREILIQDYQYSSSNVMVLEDATHQEIIDAVSEVRDRIGYNSNLLIYFAGHGVTDDFGEYFWIPSNGNQSPHTWIYTGYILKILKKINTLHTLLIFDSCFSGAANNFQSRTTTLTDIHKLYRRKSRQLITSGGVEPVLDSDGNGNSVFARSLLNILQNQMKDEILSAEELFLRLQPLVANRSNQMPTYNRLPESGDQWGQFYFIKSPKNLQLILQQQNSDQDIIERTEKPVETKTYAQWREFEPNGLGISLTMSELLSGKLISYSRNVDKTLQIYMYRLQDNAKYKSNLVVDREMTGLSFRKFIGKTSGFFFGLGIGQLKSKMKYTLEKGTVVSESKAGTYYISRLPNDQTYDYQCDGTFLFGDFGWQGKNGFHIWTSLQPSLSINYSSNYEDSDNRLTSYLTPTVNDYWDASKNPSQFSLGIGYFF